MPADATQRPRLVFAHANGFHKGMWTPVIEDLASIIPQAQLPNLQCMAFDFQGHGDRGRTPVTHSVGLDSAQDWLASTKRDVVDAAACLSSEAEYRIGVGASLGGAALVLAQLENPDLFTHLVLIEPVLVCSSDDGSGSESGTTTTTTKTTDVQAFRIASSSFERKARARRDQFASLSEASTFFASRALWSGFDERAVQAYVDGGLVAPKNAAGVVTGPLSLCCPPEYEAEVYLTVPLLSTSVLGEVSRSAEVTLCVGEKSTFSLCGNEEEEGEGGGAVAYYRENIMPALLGEEDGGGGGGAEMVVLERCTHHAAMERPMEIAKRVVKILTPSGGTEGVGEGKGERKKKVQPFFVRD